MLLILFRHGEAEDVGPDEPDSTRRLAPQGEADNQVSLRAIRQAGLRPEVIVHSPLVRARQTAQAAAEVLQPAGGLHADERLACGAELDEVRAVVADHPAEVLLLVGHNPDLSLIVGSLIGGGQVVMKTSGAACVSLATVEPGAGRLEWLIGPALFASG